ncbi:MAG TPA: DUF1049 domain-containing protein [Nitrospirae bacterium]|nr:tetratricopeptide repeat protein [bacterium BMS3Abin10]HDH50779.1 DUF1049 domain-containing protein [Nitrospirota bacterium]HDK81855.1 DUF1049 domain-containing protein [Nitrospirota bacterium]HDO25403.1 DUF1049 domain-containing protein [Nitrospirota bacterium]
MTKFTGLLVLIFVAGLAYLALMNQGVVTLKLSATHVLELPTIALILFSIVIGALSMLFVGAVRDARRYYETWQSHRQQKKYQRIQESYSKGLDAFFATRYDEATELFNRILEEEPNNVNALLRRGDIAFNRGDMVRAKEFYLKAKDVRPQSIEALFSLEKVFTAERKWQEALRCLDNILEIDGENPRALYGKRKIYEINKNWEDLLDTQYKILKSDISAEKKQDENRKLMGYKYEVGRDHLEKGDTEKAKKVLKAVVKLDKDFISAYLALAETYISEGDVKEAEAILEEGFEETSSLVFLVRLEDFFITVGEPGRIIALYQKAIQANPNDQKLQFFLAKLYYRLEMIDYAYETITGIDTATMDYPDLHTLLGGIYERRAQHENAAEEYKKALQFETPLLIPYCCSNCSYISKEWVGRCPQCEHWNTLTLDLSGTCKL